MSPRTLLGRSTLPVLTAVLQHRRDPRDRRPPDDTWCKKVDAGGSTKRYVNWLRDEHMLPGVILSIRILRYGYQSQWFGDEAIKQKGI